MTRTLPYVVGRIGIPRSAPAPPTGVVMVLGIGLQAGATGAVRAVKLGASLAAGGERRRRRLGHRPTGDGASHVGAGTAAAAADDADTGSNPGSGRGPRCGEPARALPHAGTAP